MKAQAQRVVAVLVGIAGLALIILATRSGRTRDISSRNVPYHPPKPRPMPTRNNPGRPTPSSPNSHTGTGGSIPHWITLVILIILTIIAVGLATAFVVRLVQVVRQTEWRDRNKRPDKPDAELSPADLAKKLEEAVDEVLIRIERGETNEAIIACWMRLEDVAAAAGTERRPAETSAELTRRVLAEHQVTGQTLGHLSELYREARFSAHTLPDSARDEARAALEQIRTELRTGALQ